MKRSNKLILLLVSVVVAVLFLSVMCWDTISVYLFPGKALSDGILRVYDQLQGRFEGNPLLNAAKYIDPEGKQWVDLTVKTTDPYWGEISYEMELQSQQHRFQGSGVVRTGSNILDLCVYADTQYMALASDTLLRGNYYGITYDSFRQDIRQIPLLSWMIGDTVLEKWNQMVLAVKHNMEKGYPVLKVPEIPADELQKLVLGLAAIPAKVTKENICLQNQEMDCHQIEYHFENKQVTQILRHLVPLENDAVSRVDAYFWLYEKKLVMADIRISSGESAYQIQPVFGMDPEKDLLQILIGNENGTHIEKTKISVDTVRDHDQIQEQWVIERDSVKTNLSYCWEPATGDMTLRMNGSDEFILNLSENNEGLCVHSENLSDIYDAITGNVNPRKHMFSGSAVIGKGAEFVSPEYKNLDRWSMDDFLTVMEGIGGLIGLEFA